MFFFAPALFLCFSRFKKTRGKTARKSNIANYEEQIKAEIVKITLRENFIFWKDVGTKTGAKNTRSTVINDVCVVCLYVLRRNEFHWLPPYYKLCAANLHAVLQCIIMWQLCVVILCLSVFIFRYTPCVRNCTREKNLLLCYYYRILCQESQVLTLVPLWVHVLREEDYPILVSILATCLACHLY